MRYYIADCHFYHDKLNTNMDTRGFSSAEEMNRVMIEKWNAKVKKKDEVVVLGDFSIGTGAQTAEILNALNGVIYMIRGNHDRFLEDKTFDAGRFVWVRDYAEMHDNGRKVILSHYPMLCYNGQYRRGRKGENHTYMLYGHVHKTMDEDLISQAVAMVRGTTRVQGVEEEERTIPCNLINCFCMYADYAPLSLDEWIAVTEQRRAEALL